MKPIEIARDMGMTPGRVSIIMNSPAFKNELARMSEKANEKAFDIGGRIKESSIKAMDLLEKVLDPAAAEFQQANIGLKVKVAQDMVSRAGYAPVTKVQAQVAHAVLTSDDIALLRQRRDERVSGR